LADTPVTIDPVAGLIDIPLPPQVGLWPQTWEARVAVVLIAVAVITATWRLVQYRRRNRYRREALAELDRMRHAEPLAQPELPARLSVLVRRTALAAFPREKVASLAGPAWLSFLDRSYQGREFSDGVGRLLVSGPYQRTAPGEAELDALFALVRRWIRRHHA
jgi:Domain of unknown function (DUF4381)